MELCKQGIQSFFPIQNFYRGITSVGRKTLPLAVIDGSGKSKFYNDTRTGTYLNVDRTCYACSSMYNLAYEIGVSVHSVNKFQQIHAS